MLAGGEGEGQTADQPERLVQEQTEPLLLAQRTVVHSEDQ